MNFLETILGQLRQSPGHPFVQEVHPGGPMAHTGSDLDTAVARARSFFQRHGLRRGQRCAIIGPNSARWIAIDLAIMAEGAIAVPLYHRQAAAELATILRDCTPDLICCADEPLAESLKQASPEIPSVTFDAVLQCGAATPVADARGAAAPGAAASAAAPAAAPAPATLKPDDVVALIYTSGSSGEAKGAMLTAGNLDHMVACTAQRLDRVMNSRARRALGPADRVFHYLPLCFAGSWILLLTSLTRRSILSLSTNLDNLPRELAAADPQYMLNVPQMLERMRREVHAALQQRPLLRGVFERAQRAWEHRAAGRPAKLLDRAALSIARAAVFPAIRRKLGRSLRLLICGSAPLSPATQEFFELLGLPVLQVYGLTETTAICTMDEPGAARPGYVGRAIRGVEMRCSPEGEILVRGPNIFAGYWRRPEQTAAALHDGWLHTGDLGEMDSTGRWRITGRAKNLIVLSSGHKVAPEPIEESLLQAVPAARQVVVVGDGRSHLAAIVTGAVDPPACSAALDSLNAGLPHYKKLRRWHLRPEPFTVESGLVTANGKLRRGLILDALRPDIDAMYGENGSSRSQDDAGGGA